MNLQNSTYPTGRVITFYSYKGGVGRSMSMANVGVILADWGYKVLLIDWDLEAPGLENFFSNYIKDLQKVKQQKGLIDLLNMRLENMDAGKVNWPEFIQPLTVNGRQQLHLLTAGKRDDNYVNNVRKFDYSSFYNNYDGGQYLEDIREYWIREYDFVLIDSRTGLTDSSGICSIYMPDILMLLFTPNEQSFSGIKEVYKKAAASRSKIIYERFNLHALPIPSRIENAETRLQDEWISRIAAESVGMLGWLPAKDNQLLVDPLQLIEKIKIPYRTLYAYGESLPAMDRGVNDPQDIGYVYATIAALIANGLQYAEVLVEARDTYVKVAKGELKIELGKEVRYQVSDSDNNGNASQIKYNTTMNGEKAAYKKPFLAKSFLPYTIVGILVIAAMAFFYFNRAHQVQTTPVIGSLDTSEATYNKFIADYTSSDSSYDLNFNLTSLQSYFQLDTSLQNRPQIQAVRATIEQNIVYYFKDQVKKFYTDLRNKNVNALTYFDNVVVAYGDFRNLTSQALNSKFDSLTYVSKITNEPALDNAVFRSTYDGFVLSCNTQGNFVLDRWYTYDDVKDSLSFFFSKNLRIKSVSSLHRVIAGKAIAVSFPVKYRIDLFICKGFSSRATSSIESVIRGVNKYQVVNRGYSVPSDTANPYYIKSNEIRYNGNDELVVAKELQALISTTGIKCKLVYARTPTPGIVSVMVCY